MNWNNFLTLAGGSAAIAFLIHIALQQLSVLEFAAGIGVSLGISFPLAAIVLFLISVISKDNN